MDMSFFEDELRLAGIEGDQYRWMIEAVKIMENQGHSGFSASYVIGWLKRVEEYGVNKVKTELANILKGLSDEDDIRMQNLITENILELVNHTQSYIYESNRAKLIRLLDYKPITPLTGSDEEWNDITRWAGEDDGTLVYQNKRCSSVFKNVSPDGTVTYENIRGRIFTEDGGETHYSSSDSKINITFPYEVPDHPEVVEIDPQK